ncbi:helix-turn-helix domain-containing protein, partial [Thalassorhabdomicrobium marinisediminis]|uniref:helix-turn-helix domain-containing protein n=1 Tax=Thalassorhabdomicrobium marinisediminis TaxID=2170577 RepID=UPI0024904E86
MKVRLSEIARVAGVGHATVDRVLNQRGGVKPETAKRVLDAARDLGFDRRLPTLY